MKPKSLVLVAFLMMLYIGPSLFAISSCAVPILAEQNMTKDYNVSSGENWLDGWYSRKSHTIAGSEGAGEDYNIKIKVWYDEVIATYATNGVSQPTNEINRPQAIFHNDVTYITWQAGDNTPDIYIISYNHTSEIWSNEVFVAVAGIADTTHEAPVITVDGNGYIHIIWGYYYTGMKHYKSDNIEDISAWTEQADIITDTISVAYPHLIGHGDKMYLFYSIDDAGAVVTREVWVKISNDNGASWDAGRLIIDNYEGADDYGVYHGSISWNYVDKIHMVWTYVNVTIGATENFRRHIYHAYLNLNDMKMYNISGSDLGTSITWSEAVSSCRIVDTGTGYNVAGGIPDVYLDTNGMPWVLYNMGLRTEAVDEYYGNFTFYHTRWTGSAWSTSEKVTDTASVFNYFTINYRSNKDVDAYVITADWGSTYRGGDLEKWNWNGYDWVFKSTVLTMDDAGMALNYPNVPYNRSLELQLLFCESNVTDFSGGLNLYAYGCEGLVPEKNTVAVHTEAQLDFDDILFTDDDGITVLSYWRESKTDGNNAIFWLKINDNLSEDVGIYVYSDNPSASYIGDGADTFLFYEDWSTQSVEAAKWDVIDDTDTAQITYSLTDATHGYVQKIDVDTLNAYYTIGTDLQATRAVSIVGRIKLANTAAANQRSLWGMGFLGGNPRVYIGSISGTEAFSGVDDDANVANTAMASGYFDTYQRFMITRNGTYANLYSDDTLIYSASMEPDTGSNNMIHIQVRDSEYDTYTDWMFGKSYIVNEPVHGSWGELETLRSWQEAGEEVIIFTVPFDEWALEMGLIFLGLFLIPASTIYMAKGGLKEASMTKVFFALVAFILGWAFFIGGIM